MSRASARVALLAAVAALLGPLGTGCGPKPAPAAAVPAAGHPDLQCPPGTSPAGRGPPEGTEAWCQVRLPGGEARRAGPRITWHANGQRSAAGWYQAGKRHGTWQFWHASGTPAKQGSYTQGLEDGPWTTYHPDGTRAAMGGYVGGEEHGPWIFWDPGTLTRTEGSYELGERTGRWVDVGPDGRPVRERIYRRGRLVNQRELGGG